MAIYSGFNTAIGIGAESTFGTPVSRTKWYRVERTDLQRALRVEPVATLSSSSASANSGEFYQAEETVRGSIVIPASYQDFGLIFKNALHAAPSTSGAGPYGHTYKLALALQVGLTIEQIVGTSGKSEVFNGCRIDSFEWSVEAQQYAKLTLGIIGKSAAARGSAGTPSYGVSYPVLHHHAGTLSFDGASYTCAKFAVKVANKLAPVTELGALSVGSLERGDRCEVSFEAEILYRGDALHTAQLAATQGDAAITFTDNVNSKDLTWTLHNATIHECSMPLDGVGVRRQRVVWRGYTDGTDEGLQLLITNAQSSAVG